MCVISIRVCLPSEGFNRLRKTAIYRAVAVAVAKLAYTHQALGLRGKRPPKDCSFHSTQQTYHCFCSSQLDDFNSLCDAADTRLFTKILHNPHHVLQAPLHTPADRSYNLRDRLRNRQLPGRMSHLTDCNFIVRMLLFGDSY